MTINQVELEANITGGYLTFMLERGAIDMTNSSSSNAVPPLASRMYGSKKTTRFAEYLSLLRHNYIRQTGNDMSYQDLANLSGISKPTISKWLNAGIVPTVEGNEPYVPVTLAGLNKIALLFGIDPLQFIWRIKEDNALTRLADELAYNGYGELLNMLWELYNNKPVRIKPDLADLETSDINTIIEMVRDIYTTVKQAKQDS